MNKAMRNIDLKGDMKMKTKRILMVLLIAAVMTFAMTVSAAFADEDEYKAPDMKNVAGIEFEPADGQIILEELVDGSYDYEEEYDVFYYNLWRKIEKDGSVLILVGKDGSRSRFVFDRSEYAFIGEGGYGIYDYDLEYDYMQRQYKEPWGLGDHTFAIDYKGFKCELTATVVENSIKSVEYIPAEPYKLIEYGDGWWEYDSNDNKYFDYYYKRYNDGDSIRLTMKDGSVKTYVYEYDEDDDDEFIYFRCKEDNTSISTQNISLSDDQEKNHWVKGGDNYITFKYAGKESRIPVTIIDSPIDSISYEPVSPITYTENVEGYMEEDKAGNKYFEYDEPEPREGDKLIVVQNGSSKTYTYSDDEERFICGNETIRRYDVDFYTYQENKHWILGSDNELTIRYLARECTVPVTIMENKVKKIAYEPATPYEYKELDTRNGDWDEDYYDKSYFHYDLPEKANGDKLTVTTDEGTKDYIYDDYKGGYVSEDGDFISYRSVRFSSSQSSDHWEPGKKNYMEVEYMAKECLVPVVIRAKLKNTMKASGKTIKIKFAKLKKKAQNIAAGKAFTIKNPKGTVTYKLAKKDKKAKNKITVSKKGVVTVKKGLKKGKYTVKVKVTAAGNESYAPATKTVNVKVVVK